MISDRPSRSSSAMSLPVLRLAGESRVRLSLQSRAVLYVGTHWADRQLLCVGEGCPGCEISSSRCRGFAIALLSHGTGHRPVLVEASSSTWSRVEGLRTMEGWTFGPGLELEATKGRRNAPLRLEPIGTGGPVDSQFSCSRRLISALAVLFRVPLPRANDSLSSWADLARPGALRLLESALASR